MIICKNILYINLNYISSEFTKSIREQIVKLTRGGKAYLQDSLGHFYSVPPRNVREISELDKSNSNFGYDCKAQF